MQTHETYIQSVAAIGIARLNDEERTKLAHVKIVYGTGPQRGSKRGVTFHSQWKCHGQNASTVDLIEICAFGESDLIQLAGTTLHELGHALAPVSAGHNGAWKAACTRLGLCNVRAAGQVYTLADSFLSGVAEAIVALAIPTDGSPINGVSGRTPLKGGCSVGIGTRGGKSRGVGSGSRMVKVHCAACGYIARTTRVWLDEAGAPLCPCNREPMSERNTP